MSSSAEASSDGTPRLGVVTIGQSPRPDLVGFLRDQFGDRVALVEVGALDESGARDLSEMAAGSGDERYLTRLRNGTSFSAPARLLHRRAERVLAGLIPKCDATLMLCTGDFSDLRVTGTVLYPDRILRGVVEAVIQTDQTLGVILPADPPADAPSAWGARVLTAVCDPYDGSDPAVAARDLVRGGAALLVLDCMGFTRDHRSRVRQEVDVPVILPQSLVARVVGEYLGV